jgi:hypothetical protein
LYSPSIKDFQARVAIGGNRLKREAYIRFEVLVAAGINRRVREKKDSLVAPVFVFVDFIQFDASGCDLFDRKACTCRWHQKRHDHKILRKPIIALVALN